MAKEPESKNTTDGMMVTIDGKVVWDGEGDQLGVPSLVGNESPIKQPPADAGDDEPADE